MRGVVLPALLLSMTTKEDVIKALVKYHSETGKSPTRRDVSANICAASRRLFGTWNNALVASGIAVNRKYEHTQNELLESLKRFSAEFGKSPAANDCNKCEYLFDTRTYFRKLECKSWSQVLHLAGLEEYFDVSPFIKLSDDDLLLLIKSIVTAKNAEASSTYYAKNHGALPNFDYIIQRFGSWNNVLDKIGIERNMRRYSKEDLIAIFQEAKSHFGRVPSVTEFYDYTKVQSDAYKRYFGTWRKFLKSIGEKPITKDFANVTESEPELIEMYKNFSLRNGYPNGATARALNMSDKIYSYDVFFYRFGGINKLRALCEFDKVYLNSQCSKELTDKQHVKQRCSACHDLKYLNEFSRNKNTKTGFCYICKSCFSAKNKKYRDKLNLSDERKCIKCGVIKRNEMFCSGQRYCKECQLEWQRNNKESYKNSYAKWIGKNPQYEHTEKRRLHTLNKRLKSAKKPQTQESIRLEIETIMANMNKNK